MKETQNYSERADGIADSLRTFLIAIHTGGIAVVFAVAGSLASECVNPRWAVCPAAIFSLGLVLVGFSLLLAKHKALKRRDAVAAKKAVPEFKNILWRN
jgi:hypothetical protein